MQSIRTSSNLSCLPSFYDSDNIMTRMLSSEPSHVHADSMDRVEELQRRGNPYKALFLLILTTTAIHGKTNPPKKRVCIIGAGPCGLMAIKRLSAYPEEFEPIAFEKQSDVGGMWIYTNSTTIDEHGLPVHSSLYKYLRINAPKELENLPDYQEFRGDDSNGSFPHHLQMLQFFRNYTERFNLRQFIQFNTNVENVSSLPDMRWLMKTRDLNTNKVNEVECDAVLVANGHHTKGHIPNIPGIESFPGRVIHSHVYRYPEEFANQTVVILGASFSGVDIGMEVSKLARKVYLSHNHNRSTAQFPENVEQSFGVVGANGSEFILTDGSRIKADALILCTGYDYDFPFLDESCGIVVEDGKYIRSIYKYFINIERPTMGFLLIQNPGIIHLPQAQIVYFIATLQGRVKLPSRDDMLKDAALPADVPKSKAHYMFEKSFSYYDELALAAGIDLLPRWVEAGILHLVPLILNDPVHFREKKLRFKDDGSADFV